MTVAPDSATADPAHLELELDPVPLAQRLVRFDTTNPPGAEAECVRYVGDLLAGAGIESRLYAADPARPNLVARIPGRGQAPALVLHAHVDVVPTRGQHWTHPPFAGDLVDGHLWGRGAIDMKGGLAMMLAAILRLRAEGAAPAGDVILAVVADEEAGSAVGARFLTARHPELFDGAAYAIGEDGGASLHAGGRVRTHPIVVAEKRAVWMRTTLRGPEGHGSRIVADDAAVRRLTRLLVAIQDGGLDPVMTPAVDRMLAALAKTVGGPQAAALEAFRADPGDPAPLAALPERDARYLRSVVRHTVNATVIHGGSATNVVPAEITVDLDGRLLPGPYTAARLMDALRERAGLPDLEFEILVEGEPMPEPVLGPFYDRLAAVLGALDPEGVPLPMVTTASTDARLFPALGIAAYGWLPLLLEPGAPYRDLLHAADERVPVDALRFGAACFAELLRDFP
jgi:acetylornithine deacetylase/succinyl-diaminopimelate desuccinylase-like protein